MGRSRHSGPGPKTRGPGEDLDRNCGLAFVYLALVSTASMLVVFDAIFWKNG